MRIVIPGGSGYLGRHLSRYLRHAGHDVAVLTRRPAQPGDLEWDGRGRGLWWQTIDGADLVVNLAGRTVNCRYTPKNRREIVDSRLESTRAVGEAIAAAARPPRVWLNSSSATIYRHAEDRPMDEEAGELGTGFSVDVCRQWEAALDEAGTPATRKVALRTAMVMGPGEDGPFHAYLGLVRQGLGGPTAGGNQYVSWIHYRDFCRAILWIAGDERLSGPVNVASPYPLPNREFLSVLREAVKPRFALPTPRPALEVGAFLRGTETELILKSRRVVPTRLLRSGFQFDFPAWRDAVEDLLPLSR